MSIQSEEIEFYANELLKLVDYCRKIRMPAYLINTLVQKLNKFELMILDAAFRGNDIIKLRNTILFLEEQYLKMLQNVTKSITSLLLDYVYVQQNQ